MVDDVGMKGRTLVWIAACAAAVGVGGLVAYLAIAGLDKASAVAGVVVGIVELTALVVAVYGVSSERRAASSAQVISGTAVGGNATQIRRVKGSVRIRHDDARRLSDAQPAATADREVLPNDRQSVTDSRIAGQVDQVDDVTGDVETD
jgi:hypothetical protein